MIDNVFSFFKYDFVINALIVGLLVSLCAAVLGVSLVLKRYSMIGDGLSHIGFGASAVALAVGIAPIYVSIPTVIVAAFLLLRLKSSGKIKGDAATALLSSSALAIGYTAIKLSGGVNIDINSYMFGSIYTVNKTDMIIAVCITVVVLLLYFCFYNKIFSVTFDEDFASATGIKAERYNTLLACLTAVTVVIGMRLMGALLMSALIIFPVMTASRICKSYKAVMLSASIVSVVGFVAGLLFSLALNTSPGSSIVIVNLFIFVVFALMGKALKK